MFIDESKINPKKINSDTVANRYLKKCVQLLKQGVLRDACRDAIVELVIRSD
jgi:hypothetical protein